MLRTKHSSSLMLLFLDEAETKRHVFKERCQQRFVNCYTGQITEGCVCSQYAHVSPMSPKGKTSWLTVEALYIFIYFSRIIFLASHLGGKSWLSSNFLMLF